VAGEIVSIVGESGSGKTVLGLSLLGLLGSSAQISGSVVVDGVDMIAADTGMTRRVRRRALGAVFQDPMTSLNPTMRVGRQIAESAGTEREALRLLDAVGIRDPARRLRAYPHELSGGLRQRVMIAIALAGNPKLIVADEPTTALDVTVQAQVLDLFRRIREDVGCAIVLITHDLGVASSVADRICVLYAGRVVELGGSRAVLADPAHPYSASLLNSRITLTADRRVELPTIRGEPPDPRSEEDSCSFAARCPFAEPVCVERRPLLAQVSWRSGAAACHFEAGPRTIGTAVTPTWPPQLEPRGAAILEDVVVRFPASRALFGGTGAFEALSGVTLRVGAGESVALVGESGSGKTTLLRTLAGFVQPTSGRVDTGGSMPQMVFQDAGASLTPWLRVGELLEDRVRALPRAERRERLVHVLRRLGLPEEVLGARPSQLSGGQRQRVALARAVIDPPDLLLCDEPISALDASLAASVLNLLGRLRRELGFAMIFVTHDLAAARLVSDRIVVMTEGRIVEEGPTERVVTTPAHDYTRILLESVPEFVA